MIVNYIVSAFLCGDRVPPPPPSVQQEAPRSSLPAGRRGGQWGHRGAWCCLMAVRTGRAQLQMWCQLLPGVTLERPMAACPPPPHPTSPPSVQLAPCLIRHGGLVQGATPPVTCFLHTVRKNWTKQENIFYSILMEESRKLSWSL